MAPKSISQKSSLKTTIRVTIVAVTAAVGALAFLLILVFNLMKDEVSKASTSMLYKGATVIQDSSHVLRGAINQKVIGLMVEVAGNGEPVKVNTITFNAEGTTEPVEQNISNARLWYTGSESDFQPISQVGNTIMKVDDKDFTFTTSKEMQAGKNYFWLTFDINADAESSPAGIDAVCRELRIGVVAYRPVHGSAIGKRFIEPNVPYYSMGNFSISNANAWNSKRDGSGTTPKQMHATRNSFFIQSGHHMITSTGGNLQTLIVEKGGELRITAPLRLNSMYVACGGILQQDATVTDYYCFNDFYLEGGSSYIHNNTGYLPGLNCHFSATSNVLFWQYGKATIPYNIEWGNVSFDASTPLDLDIQHYFHKVKGSLELRRTGVADNSFYTGGSDTMNVEGNFVISGGSFHCLHSKKTDRLAVRIGGDLIINGGELTGSRDGSVDFNINGDIVLRKGILAFGESNAAIHFSGKGQSKWYQDSSCKVSLGNIFIEDHREMILKSVVAGPIAASCSMQVMNGASLLCGNGTVTGPGSFLLGDNCTLGIGHPEGIYSEGAHGNIQTQSRTFNSGANYCYYTACQPQETGVFTTAPVHNSMRRLLLNKAKSSQTLTLSQPLSVSEQVLITKGDIRQGKFNFQLPDMEVSR